MATIVLDEKDFAQMPTVSTTVSTRIYTTLKIVKDTYGSIVKECALNSNVPEWLIYTVMFCSSGGRNLVRNETNLNTKLNTSRIGLFNANEVEVYRQMKLEIQDGRLNQAELDYLRGISDVWKANLGGDMSLNDVFLNNNSNLGKKDWESPLTGKKTWFGDSVWGDSSNATSIQNAYLDLLSLNTAKASIAYAAIRLGFLWDFYSNEKMNKYYKIKDNKVIDKVIIDFLSPTPKWQGERYWEMSGQNRGAVFYGGTDKKLQNMYNFLNKDNWQYIPVPIGSRNFGVTDEDKEAAANSKYAPISANIVDLTNADGFVPNNNLEVWLKYACGKDGVIQIANSL
jgi:hypothetical protein